MGWITTKSGKRINTDWFDEDEKKKQSQINANKQEADKKNNELNALLGEPSEKKANRDIAKRIEWINAGDSRDPRNADRVNNCQRCVISAELNARGYDTTALPKPKNDEFENTKTWLQALGNPTRYGLSGDDFEECNDKLMSVYDRLPENARGVIMYQRNEIVTTGIGGHVIMMEKTSQGPVFYDPQTGKIFKDFKQALGYRSLKEGERALLKNDAVDLSRLEFIRTDDAKINADVLKKYKVVDTF